jgi:4-amino-4-deoxy-L-arabinose transferase-like glycosyltransferase
MLLRKSFLVPQIHGQLYFTKPPLFNWAIAFSFHLAGNYSEIAARIPGLVSYLLTGLVIYVFAKKYAGAQKAFLAAMFFCTASDLLFFGTLIPAEIDLFFALLITVQLTSLYYFFDRKKWLAMFLVSYVLTGLSVLTKGVPAVLFEAITLLTMLFYHRRMRLLFSWQHAVGIVVFLLVTGSYFYAYQQATGKLSLYFAKLFYDAAEKSALEHSVWDSILNFLASPLQLIRFFSPWILFAVFVFRRPADNNRPFREHFFGFWLVATAINILPMLFTSETKANYIYPLYPFIALLMAHTYVEYRAANPRAEKLLNGIFQALMIIMTIAVMVAPAVKYIRDGVDWLWIKTVLFTLALAMVSFLFYRNPALRIYLLILFMVMLRLVESAYYLPLYKTYSSQQPFASFLSSIEKQAGGNDIWLGGTPERQHVRVAIGPLLLDTVNITTPPFIFFGAPYYYTVATHKVMRYDSVFTKGRYYLLFDKQIPDTSRLMLLNRFRPSDGKEDAYYFVTLK